MKASVLGIGTELTTGQVLNRNGVWISKQLKNLGLLTNLHIVTPDDRELMLSALKTCAEHSDVIFVTGGLGPTTDDFTREVVAQWAGLPLVFDEASWQHVQERLTSRGLLVREFQKQQCFYPKGSQVIANRDGTANAFFFQAHGKDVYVLPGPPKEVESTWNAGIFEKMTALAAKSDPILTKSWDCLGQGESEIAYLVEKALEASGLEIGYRVHLPYVEVKVSYFKSQSASVEKWLKAVELALAPFTVLRDGQDAAEILSRRLEHVGKTLVIDSLTGFHLINRLFPFARKLFEEKKLDFLSSRPSETELAKYAVVLELEGLNVNHARISQTHRQQKRVQLSESPYLKLLMRDRERQYFTETALLFWSENL